MDFFVQALRNNPELAIFVTLAIGFLIGRVKFGSFRPGIVVGTLPAGVLIRQLDPGPGTEWPSNLDRCGRGSIRSQDQCT